MRILFSLDPPRSAFFSAWQDRDSRERNKKANEKPSKFSDGGFAATVVYSLFVKNEKMKNCDGREVSWHVKHVVEREGDRHSNEQTIVNDGPSSSSSVL